MPNPCPNAGETGGRAAIPNARVPGGVLVKVEDAPGARKFGEAGAGNGTLDLNLTLATIRQAQPSATLEEIHQRRWILESPRPCSIGTR